MELVSTEILPIHHCLYKKKSVKVEDIRVIASHIQALNQTVENRKKLFPNCKEKEVEDTALAAQLLATGILPNECAVLCRKNVGEMNDLELIKENLEDHKDNCTKFCIFKLSE